MRRRAPIVRLETRATIAHEQIIGVDDVVIAARLDARVRNVREHRVAHSGPHQSRRLDGVPTAVLDLVTFNLRHHLPGGRAHVDAVAANALDGGVVHLQVGVGADRDDDAVRGEVEDLAVLHNQRRALSEVDAVDAGARANGAA